MATHAPESCPNKIIAVITYIKRRPILPKPDKSIAVAVLFHAVVCNLSSQMGLQRFLLKILKFFQILCLVLTSLCL